MLQARGVFDPEQRVELVNIAKSLSVGGCRAPPGPLCIPGAALTEMLQHRHSTLCLPAVCVTTVTLQSQAVKGPSQQQVAMQGLPRSSQRVNRCQAYPPPGRSTSLCQRCACVCALDWPLLPTGH